MKRLMLISVIIMLGLVVTAQAGPVVNSGIIFCTEEHYGIASCNEQVFFTTKFWKEKFFGGGPGQTGNVLMAIGQGFVLQNLVLKEAVGPDEPWCEGGAFAYVTTYEGGMLTLNSSGPWLKKGSLKSTNVTATNYSCHDGAGNLLEFWLDMEGEFEKSDYSFVGGAHFIVSPDNYAVKVDADGAVFQVGYDFDAGIRIDED